MIDLTVKKGNTCQFDMDCVIGGSCVKGSGIYGTCMQHKIRGILK